MRMILCLILLCFFSSTFANASEMGTIGLYVNFHGPKEIGVILIPDLNIEIRNKSTDAVEVVVQSSDDAFKPVLAPAGDFKICHNVTGFTQGCKDVTVKPSQWTPLELDLTSTLKGLFIAGSGLCPGTIMTLRTSAGKKLDTRRVSGNPRTAQKFVFGGIDPSQKYILEANYKNVSLTQEVNMLEHPHGAVVSVHLPVMCNK